MTDPIDLFLEDAAKYAAAINKQREAILDLQYQVELKDQRIKQLEEQNETLTRHYHGQLRIIADYWRKQDWMEQDDQSQKPE